MGRGSKNAVNVSRSEFVFETFLILFKYKFVITILGSITQTPRPPVRVH